MRLNCPECGVEVEARYAPSSDGLGELPFAFQLQIGPEHERTCRWFRSAKLCASDRSTEV